MRREHAVVLATLLLSLSIGHEASANRRRLSGRSGPTFAGYTSSALPGGYLAIIYGQSNSIGNSGGGLPVSTTNGAPTSPPYNNYEYRTSAWARAYSDTGLANTEVLGYGLLAQLTYASLVGGVPSIYAGMQTGGVNSQSYAQLQDGTSNWTNQWTEANAMRSGFAAQFPAAGTPSPMVVWLQGETDQVLGTSRATYVADLLDLWQDVCDETSAAPWSLASCLPIYVVPYGGVTRLATSPSTTNGEQSEIVMAHYEACRDYPTRFICAHPGYASAMTALNEHYSGAGHRTNGAQIARVYRHREVLNDGWTFFRPSAGSISCTNNVVTIPLIGGVGSAIAIDTTRVSRKPHLGFEYTDAQSPMPVIVSATVSTAQGAALLTLSRYCDPDNPGRVRYAYSGGPDCTSGSAGTCGTGGNVRRGSCEAAYTGGEWLCDWLTPFDEPIATVTAIPSGAEAFQDLGYGSRSTSATSWAGARSTTETSGGANVSVSAWALSPASFTVNTVLGEVWGAIGARHWSIRQNTTGRFEVYLSGTGGTALSYTCTSNNSVLTANTWSHVGWTKSGTTFTLYLNGASIACASTTGAVPANLSNPYWSATTIGGSNGGGNNLNTPIAHLAIWDVALSGADMAALYSSTPLGRPLDPRLVSTPPVHYWPLQGTWEDLGTSATPRPMYHYGSTGIVSQASLFGTSDSLATFTTADLLADGATEFTARLDLTANTPSQAGTILERDDTTSTARQLSIAYTTGRQITTRIADATSGTGQWPSDTGRDEVTTSGTAMTAGSRYRVLIRYADSGVRVWWAPLTSSTDGDNTTVLTVGSFTEQTTSTTGSIPAALTTSGGTWTVGRRVNGTTTTGLRSAQLNDNAIVLWPSAFDVTDEHIAEIGGANDIYHTSLGTPAAVFRARGASIVETQTMGAATMTGLALSSQFVTPPQTRAPQREALANVSGARRASGGTYMTLTVNSGDALDSQDKTVCAWAAIDSNDVDYDGLAWRQVGSGVGQEPFYLLMDPLFYCAGGAQTWTFGIGQQGHGVGATCDTFRNDLTPQFVCGRYLHSDTSTRGEGSVFVDGVDATYRYSTGLAVPATPGNEVPPTIAPITAEMRVAGIRSGTGLGSMDSLMYFDCALTDDEIFDIFCATQRIPTAACAANHAGWSSAVTGHACYVESWRFDDTGALGASDTGLRDLGNTASAEAAPSLP